jgi:hypothetical protein
MNKLTYIIEIVWLVLAIFCLAMGTYASIRIGFDQSYMFYILSVMALLMYLLRRYRRLKGPGREQ